VGRFLKIDLSHSQRISGVCKKSKADQAKRGHLLSHIRLGYGCWLLDLQQEASEIIHFYVFGIPSPSFLLPSQRSGSGVVLAHVRDLLTSQP
jgi:hypothetical protein